MANDRPRNYRQKAHITKAKNGWQEKEENKIKNADNSKNSQRQSDVNEHLVFLCVSLAMLATYVKTLHPSLPGGDSGELVTAAHELGVSHPPGYPLFTLLSMLAIHLVPVGLPVWKVNLLSAVFGALTSGVVYLLIYRLTQSHGAGLQGAAMFSASRLVWTWSSSAEVFSLNNLLLASLMLTAERFDRAGEKSMRKMSYIGSFVCGLCLSNQHTSILYIIFLVPWVMRRLWKAKLFSGMVLLKQALLFLLGLSPYLYLPLSSTVNMARWTWGDQSSVGGFLKHLLRQEYGTWDLLKDHSGQGFVSGMQSYFTHVTSDLTIPVSALAVLSLWSIIYRHRASGSTVLSVFSLMFAGYVTFFCWRANLDIANPLFFKVVERFWIQSDLVLVVLAAVAFGDLSRSVSDRYKLLPNHLDVLLTMPLIAWQLHRGWPTCDNSTNTVVRDFALQTLDVFPNNSIILTKGDLPSNSFRYFHLCEGVRPDLDIFDQEVLTYQWSLPMTSRFYPGITFPGDILHSKSGVDSAGRRYFTFKDLIDANYHRPIFACIGVQEYESSWKKDYDLWPYSVCWRLAKKRENLDLNMWSEITSKIADQWSYAWNSFEAGSWERVANEEMWRAKTATAMFYLDVALTVPENRNEYFELLRQSYKILSAAMKKASLVSPTKSPDDVPAYWHRNFAIVCERLMRLSSLSQTGGKHPKSTHLAPDQLTLVKLTTHHFRQFLRLEPKDPDFSKIQGAVDTLQKYLDDMEEASHS